MENLYDKWNDKRIFKIEKDRFKNKKYIYTSPFKVLCQGFNNHTLYPYLVSDIYNKYYRMKGENVLYSVICNNLSDDTLSYSRLRGESFSYLKDKHVDELRRMNIGFDEEKFISYSDLEYIRFVQKTFKALVDDGYVTLEHMECYTDFSGHYLYPHHLVMLYNDKYVLKNTLESVYSKTLDVYAFNINKFDNILDDINSLNVKDDIKNKIYDILDVKEGLEFSFYSKEREIKLDVCMKEPQYMGGVAFIALNPKYMDIMPYVTDDEALSIEDYINNEDFDLDLFTGLSLKNPLTSGDVYVFASYKFEEAVHVGIPALNTLDRMFASSVGIENIEIIDNELLVNSDFLTGKTPEASKKEIIEAFTSEEMGKTFKYYNRDKIVITCFDDLGVIVPVVQDYMGEISVLDEKFYPIYYNNRFKALITNEEKLNTNLSLKKMVFNEDFLLALSNTYARCYDMFAGNEDFFSSNTTYDLFVDMVGILNENSAVNEIFYNVLFNKYFETYNKKYKPFNKYMIIEDVLNQDFLGEQQRLGVSFVEEILSKHSSDAYRLYLLSDNINDELSITLSNIDKYDGIIKKIRSAYDNEFDQSNYSNFFFQDFVKEQIKLLELFEIKKYTNNLLSFFEANVSTHKITKTESYSFLIMLSVVIPEICEDINENIFNSRYSIFYEEFPR